MNAFEQVLHYEEQDWQVSYETGNEPGPQSPPPPPPTRSDRSTAHYALAVVMSAMRTNANIIVGFGFFFHIDFMIIWKKTE